MSLAKIEECASRRLDAPIMLVQALEPIDVSRLSEHECKQLDGLRFDQRRRDWLSGRKALKALLRSLGRDDDTSAVSFPNSLLSLTHANGLSLAAGTASASNGIGVDYEPCRVVNEKIGRWFLNRKETAWLKAQPETDRCAHLVRLWTIKEAAFKSCPDNGGLTLQELCIEEPGATSSMVVAQGESRILIFCSQWLSGFLSIAKFEGAK